MLNERSGAIGSEPNSRQLGDDEGARPLPEQRTESCMASTELLRAPSAAVETYQSYLDPPCPRRNRMELGPEDSHLECVEVKASLYFLFRGMKDFHNRSPWRPRRLKR